MNNFGFFDTNIHVNISLIKLNDKFFIKYGKVNMADKVKLEISDWNKPNYKYSYIYDLMNEHHKRSNINIIRYADFDDLEKRIIDRRIRNIKNFLAERTSKKHNNNGEIYSAVYAELLSSPYFQTDDNFPQDLKMREFKNIRFINMNQILNDLCDGNIKQKAYYEKQIIEKRKKMDAEYKTLKNIRNNNSSIDYNALLKLDKLKNTLSKNARK